MPQDTTIYWDGNAPVPKLIEELPPAVRYEVIQKVMARKSELDFVHPGWIIGSLLLFVIFFSIVAIRSRNKIGVNAAPKTENFRAS